MKLIGISFNIPTIAKAIIMPEVMKREYRVRKGSDEYFHQSLNEAKQQAWLIKADYIEEEIHYYPSYNRIWPKEEGE